MKKLASALRAALITAAVVLVVLGLTLLLGLFVDYPGRSAAIVGAALVVLLVAARVAAALSSPIKQGTVLELDLTTLPAETPPSGIGAVTGRGAMTLAATITAIERASRDKRVTGLVVRPRFDSGPMSSVQELREALIAFGKAGKTTIAVADTFGEGGTSSAPYYLATACQKIALHPTGTLDLTAPAREPNFYRHVLERLGIELEVLARYEYKSFANQLVKDELTDPDREQMQGLLDSFWNRLVQDIAAARGIDPERVRTAVAPMLSGAALADGFIDEVAYTDQVITAARAGGPLLFLGVYRKRAGKGKRSGKAVEVAVVHAVGEMHRTGMPVGIGGGPVMAADTTVSHLRAASQAKKVKAIVIRVDSPGGSAVAGDTIWREVVRIREAGTPVVVSMASVAASGGYYLAAPADRILALPATVTGSIGVVSLHPILAGAKQRLGITTDLVKAGDEPPSFSVNRSYSPEQLIRMDASVDAVYMDFTQRVAEGRGLTWEQVHEVARGRVWTGADAQRIGLVDELGGLQRALAVAVELTGAAAGSRPAPRAFPPAASPWTMVSNKKPLSSEDPVSAVHVLAGWGSPMRLVRALTTTGVRLLLEGTRGL